MARGKGYIDYRTWERKRSKARKEIVDRANALNRQSSALADEAKRLSDSGRTNSGLRKMIDSLETRLELGKVYDEISSFDKKWENERKSIDPNSKYNPFITPSRRSYKGSFESNKPAKRR